jgi:CRP-like cAMP-binding protein
MPDSSTDLTLHQRRRRPTTSELAGIPWLRVLGPEEHRRAVDALEVSNARPGDVVCRIGRPVIYWLGVVEGLLKMSTDTAQGGTMTFTGVPPGGWFGEGSLLKRELRKYDAVALSDCSIALLPRACFDWLLDSSIPFNRYLLVQLNERLSQFIGMVEYERLLDPDARMARCIADLFNPTLYPGIGPELPISQSELALLVGVSRQRANQSLQALERAGLVAVGYGGIRVLDLPGLRRHGL